MAGKIQNGFELSRQSWGALLQNKQLIAFPIISMIGMIIVSIIFFIPEAVLAQPLLQAAESGGEATTAEYAVALVVLFLYYLAVYFVIIFSNTALVGATMRLIHGQPAGVSDGLAIARARLGKIFVFALISATVGVIARLITSSGRDSDNMLVRILSALLGGLIQGAWNLAVFFAVPVIVVENVGVSQSLKRSVEIFKETWGENFIGSMAVGGVSCLAYIAIVVVTGGMIAAGIYLNLIALIIAGVILLILGLVLVALLNGAVNGIFQASLYQFARSGDAGPFIKTELAQAAFRS